MGLLSSGLSDIGMKRKTNQDSLHLNKEYNIFMVADGMGGHNGGDMASALAAKIIPEYIVHHYADDPYQTMIGAYKGANQKIYQKSQENENLKGMGTTIVSLYFRRDTLFIGNVGDSRAYLINRNKLYQLTKDHSLIQEKLNLGIYNRQKAADDPMKNVLVRTVGYDPDVEVDVYTYKVSHYDVFLICSDGLHGKVSDSDIVYIVNKCIPDPSKATEADLNEAVKMLVKQANENGGQDNISVIIVLAQ